jgi:hypothetical protein
MLFQGYFSLSGLTHRGREGKTNRRKGRKVREGTEGRKVRKGTEGKKGRKAMKEGVQ